jgi:LytS/YehU family sensor histidine kinase
LHAQRDGDELRIEVFNTGRLRADRNDGIGLSVTVSRLAQMYGDRGRFELIEQDGGVIARVAVPWSTAS